MNKYINIIIISFLSVLTYSLGIGFVLFIPIACFLCLYNNKNILLIIPSAFLAILWFHRDAALTFSLVMGIIAVFMFLVKTRNLVPDLLFVFALSLGSVFAVRSDYEFIIVNIMFSLVSAVLYAYFGFNMEGALVNQNKSRNFTYNEVIMATVSVIGATTIPLEGIHISVFAAIFFSMYFSKNQYPIHSVFFSLIAMFFLRFVYQIEEGLLIPFVSAFYMFPSIYAAISLICFCLLGWLSEITMFPVLTLQITIGISLFFELIKGTIVSRNTKESIIRGVYTQAVENVNHEVIAFASFLDMFAKDFSTPKEYSQKLSEGINNLTHYYCEGCYLKNECYSKNKGKLYTFFKNIILYSKRSDYELNEADAISFFKNCPYILEMRKSSMLISERLNLSATSAKSNTLIAQLNGISNVLRQFSVDNSLKSELDYDVFNRIHKALCDYGLNICFFEAKKSSSTDFLIEIGVKGESFNTLKYIIEGICNNFIENKTTCLFKEAANGKVYTTVIPKINFEIEYGYGSIAQEGNNVCGDNYIIKRLPNSKLIAAISDGMGKGYEANQESTATLKLVDDITNTAISTPTALQILNTFFYIQDYLEKYSTLDFLEIDRSNGELLFYKMGAASSYIFHRDGTFAKIVNEGLPFGIEEIIEAKKYTLLPDDLIVMASDGIFENIVNEKDLELFIKGISHLAPQKIAYELLNYARSHQNKTKDDMSVIALKVMMSDQ